jgi:hypothetical protein
MLLPFVPCIFDIVLQLPLPHISADDVCPSTIGLPIFKDRAEIEKHDVAFTDE